MNLLILDTSKLKINPGKINLAIHQRLHQNQKSKDSVQT